MYCCCSLVPSGLVVVVIQEPLPLRVVREVEGLATPMLVVMVLRPWALRRVVETVVSIPFGS